MTYANQLTILRMAFVPVFLILVAYGHPQGSLAVFVAAGLTDLLDGFIARNFGQNSTLGELLDPIADKFLLVSSFIALTIQSHVFELRIPLWLTITVISRDLLILISGLLIRLTLGNRRLRPSVLGKLTTALQLLTVFVVLLSSLTPGLESFFTLVTACALAMTVLSGLHYAVRGVRIIAEKEGE